ncbi:MAG: hypothetical protein DRJ68_03200 [Thermoprotei archaeon]|nr:MAG: hypothetical protein DRJ68_03200 [Thermoprotei archaeon]
MSLELKELLKLLALSDELTYRVDEALKELEQTNLQQVKGVLKTIRSYIDLLRRELEVKAEEVME